jgi:hypothetical protein
MGKSGRVMWPRETDPRARSPSRTAEADTEREEEDLRSWTRKDAEPRAVEHLAFRILKEGSLWTAVSIAEEHSWRGVGGM